MLSVEVPAAEFTVPAFVRQAPFLQADEAEEADAGGGEAADQEATGGGDGDGAEEEAAEEEAEAGGGSRGVMSAGGVGCTIGRDFARHAVLDRAETSLCALNTTVETEQVGMITRISCHSAVRVAPARSLRQVGRIHLDISFYVFLGLAGCGGRCY